MQHQCHLVYQIPHALLSLLKEIQQNVKGELREIWLTERADDHDHHVIDVLL